MLLLTDPIDEFWCSAVGVHKGHMFRSVTQGSADLSGIKGDEKAEENKPEEAPSDAMASLLAAFKLTLDGQVKDVVSSQRLTESPVCLVAGEGDMGMHMEKLLRKNQQTEFRAPRILEINPRHELIRRLAADATQDGATDRLADAAWLL